MSGAGAQVHLCQPRLDSGHLMEYAALILLAFALAADASAVAAVKGFSHPSFRWRDAFLIALLFGGFQAFMPAIGWFAAGQLDSIIKPVDHWIAFAVLTVLGVKTAWPALQPQRGEARDSQPVPDEPAKRPKPFGFAVLVVLAFATSIDALASGTTLPTLGVPLGLAIAVIGGVTFACSWVATYAGRRAGLRFTRHVAWLGGLVLVALGVKILVTHLLGMD